MNAGSLATLGTDHLDRHLAADRGLVRAVGRSQLILAEVLAQLVSPHTEPRAGDADHHVRRRATARARRPR